MRPTRHEPIREGDQFSCSKCGKAWDVKDPDPPPCVTKQESDQEQIDKLREVLHHGET